MIMSKSCKKIISSLMCVMALIIGVCSFSFNSYANGYEFFVPYAEPCCDESSGYLNLLMRNKSTGEYFVNTYFWNITSVNSSQAESSAYAHIVLSSSSLYFTIAGNAGTVARYHLAVYGSSGQIVEVASSGSASTERSWSGSECVGFMYRGNVGYFERKADFSEYLAYTCYFSSDSSAVLISSILDLIGGLSLDNDTIISQLYSIMNNTDGLENQLSSVVEYLKSCKSELVSINVELDEIFYKASSILDEQKKSNSWLEKIWNSIREFISPSDDDKQKSDEYTEESSGQKNEIDDLNKNNQTVQPDIDSSASSVDENIDYDSVGAFGGVLAVITNNKYVLQMILASVSVLIIGYVLFGKR